MLIAGTDYFDRQLIRFGRQLGKSLIKFGIQSGGVAPACYFRGTLANAVNSANKVSFYKPASFDWQPLFSWPVSSGFHGDLNYKGFM